MRTAVKLILRQWLQLWTEIITTSLFNCWSILNLYSHCICCICASDSQTFYLLHLQKKIKIPNFLTAGCSRHLSPEPASLWESWLQVLTDVSVAYTCRSLNKSFNHNVYVGASTGGRWRSCTHIVSLLSWERSSC